MVFHTLRRIADAILLFGCVAILSFFINDYIAIRSIPVKTEDFTITKRYIFHGQRGPQNIIVVPKIGDIVVDSQTYNSTCNEIKVDYKYHFYYHIISYNLTCSSED